LQKYRIKILLSLLMPAV